MGSGRGIYIGMYQTLTNSVWSRMKLTLLTAIEPEQCKHVVVRGNFESILDHN
jgi:hypothetical protein